MPRCTDQQLRIIGAAHIAAQDGVVGRLFTQLMTAARQHPDERVEPQERGRDAGE